MCPLPGLTAPAPAQTASPGIPPASPNVPPLAAADVRHDADVIDSACSDASGWA